MSKFIDRLNRQLQALDSGAAPLNEAEDFALTDVRRLDSLLHDLKWRVDDILYFLDKARREGNTRSLLIPEIPGVEYTATRIKDDALELYELVLAHVRQKSREGQGEEQAGEQGE